MWPCVLSAAHPLVSVAACFERWSVCAHPGYCFEYYFICLAEWCKVYCCEDSKIHVLSTKVFEPEDSDVLKEGDLFKGNTLLWKFKGKRYTVTVLEVYGKDSYSFVFQTIMLFLLFFLFLTRV